MITGLGYFVAAIEMNVAVEEVARLKPTHKGEKTAKAGVGQVRLVVNLEGWRVGDQYIEPAAIAQPIHE